MPTNNLSWSPAGGAVTSQKIKRGTDPSPTTVLATVGAAANTYADTTAQEKNDYYYVVESICANGDALSNEVTICNDGDVSAPICLGGITFDDTNSPYSGFTEDNYLGNIYGGHADGPNGTQAHHISVHNPNIPSYPFVAATCSNYNPTNYPYGYCDGIYGGYNVDPDQLPGNYSGVYFYIGLGVERSSDGGTTKEVIGELDPSTDAVMRTVATSNPTQSDDIVTCDCSEGAAYSYINSSSQTINFRPTGTDSIYYTLFPIIDANISPVRIKYSTITGDNPGYTCSTGFRGRMRAVVGVTESGVNYNFSGVQPTGSNVGGLTIYDTGWEQSASVTGTTTSDIRNKVLNASNDLYVTVDAYEALQYGQVTRVTVTYTVNGGTPISLGILYGPSVFTGTPTNKITQTYTISRSAGDFIRIKLLCDSTSGGGGA
mgnify:CR=1 FL=1